MLDRDECYEIVHVAVLQAKRCGLRAEIVIESSDSFNTRSGDGHVYQAASPVATHIRIRLQRSGRSLIICSSTCNVAEARLMVRDGNDAIGEDPRRKTGQPLVAASRFTSSEGRRKFAPLDPVKVDRIHRRVFESIAMRGQGTGLNASASLTHVQFQMAVGNTRGLFDHYAGSTAVFSIVVCGGNPKLKSEAVRVGTPDSIDIASCIEEGFQRAVLLYTLPLVDPFQGVRPGYVAHQNMVMGARGVQEWLTWMVGNMFDGENFESGISALSGSGPGDRIVGPTVTITEDPFAPGMRCPPFDERGWRVRPVQLIKKGCFCSALYSAETATQYDRVANAYSFLGDGDTCLPNIHMDGGRLSYEQLVAQQTSAIESPRVHYSTDEGEEGVHFTGTTRGGTFVICDGERIGACESVRFRFHSLNALKRITGMSRPQLLLGADLSGGEVGLPTFVRLPAIAMRNIGFMVGCK